MNVERFPTHKLIDYRDSAERLGNWDLFERCEAELERREYDNSDPAVIAEREEREESAARVIVITDGLTIQQV